MEYRSILFGDGQNTTRGWLIINGDVVHGILLEQGTKYILHFSPERALQNRFGHPIFDDWSTATTWIEGHLAGGRGPTEPGHGESLPSPEQQDGVGENLGRQAGSPMPAVADRSKSRRAKKTRTPELNKGGASAPRDDD
jgi:hypothetical protein